MLLNHLRAKFPKVGAVELDPEVGSLEGVREGRIAGHDIFDGMAGSEAGRNYACIWAEDMDSLRAVERNSVTGRRSIHHGGGGVGWLGARSALVAGVEPDGLGGMMRRSECVSDAVVRAGKAAVGVHSRDSSLKYEKYETSPSFFPHFFEGPIFSRIVIPLQAVV